MIFYYLKFCVILSIAALSPSTALDTAPIRIPLKTYDAYPLAQVFNHTVTLPANSETQILVTNLNRLIKYFIIQIHSLRTTLLSNTTTFTASTTVSGTNIGLLQRGNLQRYQFYAKNPNEFNSTILILVVAYPKNVPIPGGCNMEYMVETAPYQILNYTDDVVTVEAQSAALEGFVCESALVNYKMYHMYLPERDYSAESYFDAIMKMVTPEDVEENGYEIHKHIPNKQLRRLYSSYQGTGAIYALIAYNGPKKAAYVPIATYACDPLNWESSCYSPCDNLAKVFQGIMFFVGLFLCFYGHKFFKNEVFVVGALLGWCISHLILTHYQLLGESGIALTSMAIGAVSGLVWLAVWYVFGKPLLTMMAVLTAFGFVVSAIIFQAGLGDINIFVSDLNYWSCLSCISLMAVILTIGFTHKANMLASSTIGALICTFYTDFFVGSYLRYIFVNVIRRANVQDFGYAVLHGPFQYRDILLTCMFALLICLGTCFQLYQSRGRPPFAPSPYHSSQIEQLSERTPLLVHVTSNAPSAPNYRLIA